MMPTKIPKFTNPHFLQESSRATTRAEIFEPGIITKGFDEAIVAELNALVGSSIVVPASGKSGRPRKRMKTQHISEGKNPQKVMEFRLLSGAADPILISLEPKPPPPSVTREPECEDSPAAAERRRWQAQQAAVSMEWLAIESQKIYHTSSRRRVTAKSLSCNLSCPPPAMGIIQKPQPPRTTRPPLPPDELSYPYVSAAPIPDLTRPTITSSPDVFFVELGLSQSSNIRRRRRSRTKVVAKVRPQTTFWQPDPSWTGKCLGYAYGYSSRRT